MKKVFTKTTALNYMKQIQKQKDNFALLQDELEYLIIELEELKENCTEAWDCLQDAQDALSRMSVENE